jgi:protein subunit release factor B
MPTNPSDDEALVRRWQLLGLRDEDIDESFVRSGGSGGQNVNKVSTCVVLIHRPTGTLVKCQEERSQSLNRYRARVLLADKIEAAQVRRERAAADAAERLRRQKRQPSRAAKARNVERKRARSRTKSARGRVRAEE